MLTMDWKDLQYRKPKPIKKKVKQKKGSQVVSVKYPLGKTSFSASNWEEYQQWIKQQKKEQLLQEKASKALKKSKGKTTKAKGKKAVKTPKNNLTRKEQYQLELKDKRWKDVSIKIWGLETIYFIFIRKILWESVNILRIIEGNMCWKKRRLKVKLLRMKKRN